MRNHKIWAIGLSILPPDRGRRRLRSGELCGAPLEPAITRTIVLVLPTNRPTGQHLRCSVDVLASRAKRAVDRGLAQAKG